MRSAPAPTSTAGRVGDAWRGRGGAARGRMRDARAKRLYTRRYRVRKPVQRRRNVPRRITWRKTDPGSPLWRPARAPLTDTRRMPERCGIRARNPRGLCIKPEPCRPGPAQLPPRAHADTRPSSDRLRVRPRGRSVSVIQLRRALLEVGHIVHILQLAWHLERAVDKPPKLVEHVTVEIAQVEALDLLREVHVVPSQSDEP